jgi:hypothetical protein
MKAIGMQTIAPISSSNLCRGVIELPLKRRFFPFFEALASAAGGLLKEAEARGSFPNEAEARGSLAEGWRGSLPELLAGATMRAPAGFTLSYF